MSTLLARTGRHRQRYVDQFRLVAGCIPYKLDKTVEDQGCNGEDRVLILMISTPNRSDLVFPKGGWENDETLGEAACREAIEEAGVKGILGFGLLGSSQDRAYFPHLSVLINSVSSDTSASLSKKNSLLLIIKETNTFQENPLGVWEFRSKSSQNSCSLAGGCRGYMFALQVTEELDQWPGQASYNRKWVTVNEAFECCRYDWMRDALKHFLLLF